MALTISAEANLPKLRVLIGPLKAFLNEASQAKKLFPESAIFSHARSCPFSKKFSELAAYIASPEYLLAARHPDHPTAFTRDRKLPLASLVAVLHAYEYSV